MAPEPFAPGTQVVHKKMQLIGTVEKVTDDLIHVKIGQNKPIQVWKKEELAIWDERAEIQKRLRHGGFIRNIFNKTKDNQ